MRELWLKRDEHSNTVMRTLEGLLENNVLVDCTLAAGGQFLKAHQIILSACSPYFQLLFTQDMNKHPIIVFKDVEYKFLKMVLEYVYRGRVQVAKEQLNTFLEVANSLQIVGLDTRNKESSEESGSQTFDSSVRGIVAQMSQQSSANGMDSKSVNIINSGNLPNLSPVPSPVQTDAHTLDSTSTIHIQSVYSLTSESTSTPHNVATEDLIQKSQILNVISYSEVSNSKCNIKGEPVTINGNHNGCAINSVEQPSISSDTVPSSRNKYSAPDVGVQVEHINSSENLDTANRVSESNGSSKNKYPYPDSSVYAKQTNSDERSLIETATRHGLRIKRARMNPFSSGSETKITNTDNEENASGKSSPVNSTHSHFPESILLATKVNGNQSSKRSATDTSESVGTEIHDVQSLTRKNILPKCVVQAERLIIDKYLEGNSSTSVKQRKVSKFRVIHPRNDSVKIHTIKDEKSISVPIKENKNDSGAATVLKCPTARDLNLPPSIKVRACTPADSGNQKPEDKQYRSNSSQGEKSLLDKSTLLSHAFNQSSSSSEKMSPCNICNRQSCDKSTCHMQAHTEDKTLSCSKCDKKFTLKNSLDLHERTHVDEKPYKSNNSDKNISQSTTSTQHDVGTQSGKRPFKCKFCQMSFLVHCHLVRHLLTHTKEKPFICNICERGFALKENLVTHIRIHTGEKPYKCKICQKAFAQHSSLSRHKLTHSAH